MSFPRATKFLGIVLAWVLVSPIVSVQASENSQRIMPVTIAKTLQFEGPEGNEVLVPPGTYTVKTSDYEITLKSQDGQSFALDATEAENITKVPFPIAMIQAGTDLDLPDHDLLVIVYPNGHTLQAMGAEPEIVSRAIPENIEEFLDYTDPDIVTLKQPAYFTGPDGSPVLVEAGDYKTEAAQEWIRLTPGNNPQDALLLKATQGTHETGIQDPLALSLPGGVIHELDVHQVMLLLPTGETFEAIGSYSGIKTRGFWPWEKKSPKKKKRRAKRVKRKQFNLFKAVGNEFKKATRNPVVKKIGKELQKGVKTGAKIGKGIQKGVQTGVKAGWKSSKWALAQAKKGVEKGSKAVMTGVKWVGKQGSVAACKTTLGLMKAGKGVGDFMKNMVAKATGNRKRMKEKFKKDSKFKNEIMEKIKKGAGPYKQVMNELSRIQKKMNDPRNKKKLDSVFSPKHFCKDSIPTMETKLKRLGFAPNFALVRSRGFDEFLERFFIGYQVTLDVGLGLGIVGGTYGVTNFKGTGGRFWFLGAQGGIVAGGGGSVQIVFYPSVDLESFSGGGWGVGGSIGKVATFNLDVMFDEHFKKFQGFGVGGGGGLGPAKMWGDVAVSWDYSWGPME